MLTIIMSMNGRANGLVRWTLVPLALTLLTAARCGEEEIPPAHRIAIAGHAVQEARVRFDSERGSNPEVLEELCGAESTCALLAREYLLDSWKRPYVYASSGGDFQLRSSGPDGRPGTGDDLVYSPSAERAGVAAIAGCYEISLSRWSAFSGTSLRLDTASVAPGNYRILPSPNGFVGTWYPFAGDSLRVAWSRPPAVAQLVLRATGDSLSGYWVQSGDAGGTRRHTVTAHRQPCAS